MTMPFTEDALVQQTTAEYLRDEIGWEAADFFHEIECACGSPLGRAVVVDIKDLAVVKKEFAADWSGYLQVGMRIGDNERLIQLSQQRVF